MAISNEFIEEVRSRNDIVAVLGEYLNLKKAGRNYRALCPFHSEKSPSFMVSADKQIFHCFGCQAGGNVFRFVMKIDNLTFMEAVEKLAKRAGLTMPTPVRSKEAIARNKEKEDLYAANELAGKYYEYCLQKLPEAKTANNYLHKRGLSPEILKKFRIGYAPQSGEGFLKAALGKGAKQEVLQKAGLVNYNGSRYYDYFRGRVIYPILDAKGRIVAFGARTLDDTKQPKYLNSAESSLFAKSKLLYGLNWASASIRQKNQVLLLEGYMDVIACHQFGVENCVATMGVALGPDQIELIKRYAGQIVILYDSDQAGVAAALRGLDLLIDSGLEVRVAVINGAKDPDELLHKEGRAALDQVIASAMTLVEYRLQQLVKLTDITGSQGKIFVANELLPLVARIKNILEQKEEVRKIAQRLELNEETLFLQLKKIEVKGLRQRITQSVLEQSGADTGFKKAQRDLIQLFLNDSNLYKQWQDQLNPEELQDPDLRRIWEGMETLARDRDSFTPSEVIDLLEDDRLTGIVAQLSFNQLDCADGQKMAGELIKSINESHKKERYKLLSEEISRMLEKSEPVNEELYAEYKKLTKEFKGTKI